MTVLLAAVMAVSQQPAHGAVAVIAGSCVFELEVTTRTTGPTAGFRDVATESGACSTSSGGATGTLMGEFGPFPTYDCVGGVGDGHVDFTLDFGDDWIWGWSRADLEVANKGGAIEFVFFELGNPHIAASGHFVQSAEDTLACMNGATTVTWTGVLVFEDPVVEA